MSVIPTSVDSISAEWLIPKGVGGERVLLYIHGGAWIGGSARAGRGYVSKLAKACDLRALSIDYRLAPEHPFPAALDDCVMAYRWLRDSGVSPEHLVVMGESSGGNVALALMVALRDAGEPLPAGCVGISAITDVPHGMAADPFFQRSAAAYVADTDPSDPLISPIHADLSGLPPMLLQVGGDEMLVEQAVPFGERAVAAGVQAQTVAWPEMFHVFQMSGSFIPEARRANAQIIEFIRSRLV